MYTKQEEAISARTIRKRLNEVGFRECKGRSRGCQIKTRSVAWNGLNIRRHKHFEANWSRIVWSDESNFEIFGTPDATYVRRRVGEEYHPDYVVSTVKHEGGNVMIWGCMGLYANGVGEIENCEGRMDSRRYISVLKAKLQPFTSGFLERHRQYDVSAGQCSMPQISNYNEVDEQQRH